jgi:hypothetical protein
MPNLESRCHYTAFCSYAELDSALRFVKSTVTPQAWIELELLHRHSPQEFWKVIPGVHKELLRRSIEFNLYTYIGEMVEKLEGFYTFSYAINTDDAGNTKVYPVNDKDQRDILESFGSASLQRDSEILTPDDIERRQQLRHSQMAGLTTARNYMLEMGTEDAVIWTSPPGDPIDGFGTYSFVYIAQKRNTHIIDVFSLALEMSLRDHAKFLNSFNENSSLIYSLDRDIILGSAILARSSTLDQVILQLKKSLADNPCPENLEHIALEKALNHYHSFVDNYLNQFFQGKSAFSLQELVRSFNRQNKAKILANGASGSFGSCGEVDFGNQTIPGLDHTENLKSSEFCCPACGGNTDPCLGYCVHCLATPTNWKEIKIKLENKNPDSPQSLPLLSIPTFTIPPKRNLQALPPSQLKEPLFNDNQSFPDYVLVISGLSVLKIYSQTSLYDIYINSL